MRAGRYLGAAFLVLVMLAAAPAAGAAESGQEGPEVVRVGIYIEHLSDVDLKEGSFQADFYLWFLWRGDIDPTASFEFTNTLPLELHSVATSTAEDGSPEPVVFPDGSKHQIFHVNGRFLGQFEVDDYPLDDGRLVIAIEDAQYGTDSLVYEFDQASAMSPNARISGWKVKPPVGTVTEHRYNTTFGDPTITEGQAAFSRVEMSLHATRPKVTLAIQHVFPLVVIILAALASLLIDSPVGEGGDAHWWFLATRLSLAVPAVIAAVALQFTASPGIPHEGQVLLIDRIYLLSYAVILLIILVTVVAHRVLRRGSPKRAERIDRWTLALLTPGYLGGILLILLVR